MDKTGELVTMEEEEIPAAGQLDIFSVCFCVLYYTNTRKRSEKNCVFLCASERKTV